MTNIHSLQKYTNRARLSFFITMGILVALTIALLAVTANSSPIVHTIIIGVAFIVFLLAILMYLLDTAGRVRTSSSKLYWGRPNTADL